MFSLLLKELIFFIFIQKTTDRLIAAGVKQITSLGVNIWYDNKLQLTLSEVLQVLDRRSIQKDSFGQKNEKKCWLRNLKGSAGMLLKHISKPLYLPLGVFLYSLIFFFVS